MWAISSSRFISSAISNPARVVRREMLGVSFALEGGHRHAVRAPELRCDGEAEVDLLHVLERTLELEALRRDLAAPVVFAAEARPTRAYLPPGRVELAGLDHAASVVLEGIEEERAVALVVGLLDVDQALILGAVERRQQHQRV